MTAHLHQARLVAALALSTLLQLAIVAATAACSNGNGFP